LELYFYSHCMPSQDGLGQIDFFLHFYVLNTTWIQHVSNSAVIWLIYLRLCQYECTSSRNEHILRWTCGISDI